MVIFLDARVDSNSTDSKKLSKMYLQCKTSLKILRRQNYFGEFGNKKNENNINPIKKLILVHCFYYPSNL